MPKTLRALLSGLSLAVLASFSSQDSLAAPRFFGHYKGHATVTTSPFYPPGVYPAEVLIAQSESGIVGYVNIAYDPSDLIGGTITHSFSSPVVDDSRFLTLKYSDRLCGGGDPIGKCFPQGRTQYSFEGSSAFRGDQLVLLPPAILPDLPYTATLPFDVVEVNRTRNRARAFFEGAYQDLNFVWMGTIFLPLPLPIFGHSRVLVKRGEVVEWVDEFGNDIPIPGVITDSCFDDHRGIGWMNQQGRWVYDWLLDHRGRGLSVIVSFAHLAVDCERLKDPLEGKQLDVMHANLVGIMIEDAP
jgi:hypothetical protein